MSAPFMKKTRAVSGAALFLVPALLGMGTLTAPVQAKGSVSYIPGISLVPEVLQPDGVTDRTYNTPQGLSLWTESLPVLQGDKVKLNVFAATGGSELKEIKIRLDNTKIADVTSAPWHTVLDTATLQPGYHMVEVWALASGDKPQSATKTLQFFVTKQLQPALVPTTEVKGIQQQRTNGATTETNLSDTPQPPDFLKGQTPDPAATVTISARSAASSADTGGTPVMDAPVTINEPTLFIIQPATGSTATKYAYALVRDGMTFASSDKPLSTSYDRVRIEQRTDTEPGLRSGTVTMWVWGINAQGQPSEPVKTVLNIP